MRQEELKRVLSLARRLYDIVSEHSGDYWCGYTQINSPRMDVRLARQLVGQAESPSSETVSPDQWGKVLTVLIRLPHYNIRVTSDPEGVVEAAKAQEVQWLECVRPRMVLRCRINYLVWLSGQLIVQAVHSVLFYLTTLLCLVGILFAGMTTDSFSQFLLGVPSFIA